jgi:hypothetical protein
VFVIQYRRLCKQYLELTTIRILAYVGHREQSFSGVGQPDTFIIEGFSVDGHPALSVHFGGVAALHERAFDESVELGVLVGWEFGPFLSGAEAAEIFRSFGSEVSEKLEYDGASFELGLILLAYLDVEVDLRIFGVEIRQS